MSVPNLTDQPGVEFLEFRDALSVHGERWRVCRAMVERRRYVSFEVPSFYCTGFNSDVELSRWLADQARSYAAEQANTAQGESHV